MKNLYKSHEENCTSYMRICTSHEEKLYNLQEKNVRQMKKKMYKLHEKFVQVT